MARRRRRAQAKRLLAAGRPRQAKRVMRQAKAAPRPAPRPKAAPRGQQFKKNIRANENLTARQQRRATQMVNRGQAGKARQFVAKREAKPAPAAPSQQPAPPPPPQPAPPPAPEAPPEELTRPEDVGAPMSPEEFAPEPGYSNMPNPERPPWAGGMQSGDFHTMFGHASQRKQEMMNQHFQRLQDDPAYAQAHRERLQNAPIMGGYVPQNDPHSDQYNPNFGQEQRQAAQQRWQERLQANPGLAQDSMRMRQQMPQAGTGQMSYTQRPAAPQGNAYGYARQFQQARPQLSNMPLRPLQQYGGRQL